MLEGGLSDTTRQQGSKFDPYPTEDDTEQRRLAQIRLHRKHGLREFIIEGESVWALNSQNALKKYNKIPLTERMKRG